MTPSKATLGIFSENDGSGYRFMINVTQTVPRRSPTLAAISMSTPRNGSLSCRTLKERCIPRGFLLLPRLFLQITPFFLWLILVALLVSRKRV
jgi:hypothetical protein